MKQRSKSAIIYFLGILTGFGFYYLRTLCTFDKDVVYKDDIADMTISTDENLQFKYITISKGNNPLVKFELDKINREIEKAALFDERKHIVGLFYVTDGKFSGIEMLTDEMVPFFQVVYDDQTRRWHQATYCKQTESDMFIGEFYEDTNVDGQFDVIDWYNKNGDYAGNAVYFNGTWNHAISLSEDSLSAEIAANGDPNESLKLLFDFKEGWVPASMKNSTTTTE